MCKTLLQRIHTVTNHSKSSRRSHFLYQITHLTVCFLYTIEVFFRNLHLVVAQNTHDSLIGLCGLQTKLTYQFFHIAESLVNIVSQIRPRYCHQCLIAFSSLRIGLLQGNTLCMEVRQNSITFSNSINSYCSKKLCRQSRQFTHHKVGLIPVLILGNRLRITCKQTVCHRLFRLSKSCNKLLHGRGINGKTTL